MGASSVPSERPRDRQLAESRACLAGIVQSAMDAIITIDADQRIVLFNAAAEAMFRCPASAALGSPVERFVPQRVRQAHAVHIHEFAATGTTNRAMGRLGALSALRADGEEFPVEASISQVTVDGQQLLTVILRDITERKQAEAAIRASEERFRHLAEAMPQLVWIAAPDGTVEYYNQRYREFSGIGPQADGSWQWEPVLHPDDLRPTVEAWRHAVRTGTPYEMEHRVQRADGSFRWYLSRGVPIQDRAGRVLKWYGTSTDVDDQKRAEQALRLSEERFRVAKAAAEAASDAKSQFLANMSHELRTPMNAILGMADLALGEDLAPHVRDYLQTAKESGTVLLELLNQLLEFSRIEAGVLELEEVPLSVRQVVEQAVKTLGVQAAEKKLELICDIDSDVPDRVMGDPLRLREILMNLIGNAIKFTQRGEVVVKVESGERRAESGEPESGEQRAESGEQWPLEGALCLEESPDQRTEYAESGSPLSALRFPPSVSLRFSVADTGIGIAPEDRKRIFSPFTQADASTTRRHGGSGLGLAIVRELVDAMGGKVWVDSQPGRGSTFVFTVRLQTCAESADTEEIKLPARESLGGLRALVVTENTTSRRVLLQYLAGWGLQPDAASDVPNALAKIHEAAAAGQCYRLVLADARMSGVDGVTFATWLHNGPSLAGPVILMLAATDRRHLRDNSHKLNGVCLEKPFCESDLWKAVAEALDLESAGDRPRTVRAGLSAAPPRSLRVLLAEDNPANQKLAVHILSKRGHVVHVAGDGEQAVELLRQREFDLVLMDVQMPVMDGFQATAAIRRLDPSRSARLPIIAMTAHARRGDAERCLAAGMDAYLSKPIKGEELLELVERLGSCSTEVAGPGTSPGVEDRPAAAVSPSEDPGRGTDPRSCADLRAARRPGSCSAGFGRSSVRDVPAMLGEGPSTPPEPSALGTGLALGAGLPAPPESPTAGLQPALEADRLPVCGPGRGRSKRARKRDSKAVHPPAAFDVTEAIACCFGSPDILHQMIDFYFGEAPDLVAQMHAALSARNRREVARAAHRLRGTLVHLAAHPAAAAADRLEQLIAEGNLAEAAEQLAELGRQLERLEAALNAVRRAGAASENRGLAPSG